MEDGGGEGTPAVAAAAAEAVTAAAGETLDLLTAVQLVMRKSLAYGGLIRGLHESTKAIERHTAHICLLADDCDHPDYVKLVRALCVEHNVNLISVASAKTLGEWAGLCKLDSGGTARKVVKCSCVVIKDYGEEIPAFHVVQDYLRSR